MDVSDASPIEILLVEDNESDIFLTQRALQKKGRLANRINVVRDGVEALDYLFKRGQYANAPRPDLILLDLNLPKRSGLDVLDEIRKDPGLTHLPVIIMTGSEADVDIVRGYTLHANCYVTKPVQMEDFIKVMQTIADFWVTVVKRPLAPAPSPGG